MRHAARPAQRCSRACPPRCSRRAPARAATVTDGAGRAVPVPDAGRARVSRPGRRPRSCSTRWRPTAARLAARQPAGGARVPAARRRQPAGGRPHHRPRQHRQSRGRAGAQARPHPRRRLDRRRPSCRSPTACRSRPAFPMRCSTAASTRSRRPIASSASWSAGATQAEALARYADDTHDDDHRPHRRGAAGAAAARLLRARAARARDRARRLDQRRDHRVPRRAQRGGRDAAAGSPTSRSSRCCCGIPTSSSPSTRISRPTCAAIRSGRRSPRCATGRVHLSPKMPFGWVDFPPSVNRLIGLWWLAKILYPEQFPGGPARADPRFLHAASIT